MKPSTLSTVMMEPPSYATSCHSGVREQQTEAKKKYYTRVSTRNFQFHSNFDLYKTSGAMWGDTITCAMAPNPPDPQQPPQVCREIMFEYCEHVMKVGHTVYELVSETLGLNPSYLKDIGCCESNFFLGHYYPPCPEPEQTFGLRSHVDFGLLTILMQDQIGGLQILHQNQWVDVPPVKGGLIINVGDFIQLITNDKFKSVKHRAVSKKTGPRISVATLIKELLTDEEGAIYKETTYN